LTQQDAKEAGNTNKNEDIQGEVLPGFKVAGTIDHPPNYDRPWHELGVGRCWRIMED